MCLAAVHLWPRSRPYIKYSQTSLLESIILLTYLLTYLLAHSLTHSTEQSPSWEAKPISVSKKFPAFYGTRRFITAFTSARSIQSIPPHSTSWRSILILSSHPRLCLPSGLLSSGFPTQTPYTPPLSPHMRYMPRPSHSSRFYHTNNIGWEVQYRII